MKRFHFKKFIVNYQFSSCAGYVIILYHFYNTPKLKKYRANKTYCNTMTFVLNLLAAINSIFSLFYLFNPYELDTCKLFEFQKEGSFTRMLTHSAHNVNGVYFQL